MGDVEKQASTETHQVTLNYPGGTAEFPIHQSAQGASSIDISSLTRQTGLTTDRKSTRLNSSHLSQSRMPSSA